MSPEGVLSQLRSQHGIDLIFDGRCPGGEVGAYYARSDHGHRCVFKWFDGTLPFDHFPEMVRQVSRLRTKGYLLPRYWPPYRVDGGVVVLQDAVEGAWSDEVSQELVETMLNLNDLQAGEGNGGGAWSDFIRMTLIEGADEYCLHDTLRRYDGTTRRIVDWIESVGRSMGSLPSHDVVHMDFHHRNVLRQEERVVAVVDWEGSRSGDRVLDLVTFCFGFTHARAALGAESRIWERAKELADHDSLVAYVAHMALRRFDWTIRHHEEELDRLRHLADRYINLVA